MYAALWISLALLGLLAIALVYRTLMSIRVYGPRIRRMFDESPIFSPTEGTPHPNAEEVEFPTTNGLKLRGCYLATPSGKPKALIVFCHEFRSDRWSGVTYWEFLRQDGFDIFSFDFRNHGTSDSDPNYKPRHWVTDLELADLEAALRYIRGRAGSKGLPLGLYGISRGGGAAIGAAARDRTVGDVVTDGAFPTHSTVLSYMRRWISLIVGNRLLNDWLPSWYLGIVRDAVLAEVERDLGCRFLRLERAIRRIAPRPLLMIHGGRDSYIPSELAQRFYERAREPRQFWIVEGARHNACLETAGDEYRHRVREFFRNNLAPGNLAPPHIEPSRRLEPATE